MSARTVIHNARLLDPATGRDETGGLIFENGVITDIGPHIGPDLRKSAPGTDTRIDAKGLSTMRPLDRVTVAAGASLAFTAGGRHLMLIGLKSPLVAGEKVPVTLTFEGDAPLELQLDVRPLGATAPPVRTSPVRCWPC